LQNLKFLKSTAEVRYSPLVNGIASSKVLCQDIFSSMRG
jgi:hypothetical protein